MSEANYITWRRILGASILAIIIVIICTPIIWVCGFLPALGVVLTAIILTTGVVVGVTLVVTPSTRKKTMPNKNTPPSASTGIVYTDSQLDS